MAQTNLPTRSNTTEADDDVFGGEDTSETTKLFLERLQAYKHACGYFEDYIQATEKNQVSQAKEYEKSLKTVSRPLREPEHFDQGMGGIAELFDNIRQSTQSIANTHTEAAKQLKGTVLPIFERLHSEIKNKAKELEKGVGKNSKAVDKARAATSKHLELLGQHTASHDSAASGKLDAANDPYILHKGVYHRLNKQIQEENANRQDMLTVQSNFAQFEAHVIQVFQQGMGHFMQTVGLQSDNQKQLYGVMTEKAQAVNPLHEWNAFVQRRKDLLIDPNIPQRSIDTVSFPNQNHKATQPLIQGSLERKTGLLKKWDSGLYIVTPSKFLHQFSTDDNYSKDPSADLSLYLPDCTIGGCQNGEFSIKGKDVGKGKLGNALSTSSEYKFKGRSASEAEQWWSIIRDVSGASGSGMNSPVSPTSPVGSRNVSGAHQGIDTTVAGQQTRSVPQSATTSSSVPTATSTGTTVATSEGGGAGGYGNLGQSGLERKPGEY